MTARPTVLVADDHAVVAEALASSLSRWFRVLGTVTELHRVEGEILAKAPDVVLLDLEFGKTSVLTILDRMVKRCAPARFVILTAFAEPVFADAALRAGALGYVVKASAASELRIAVEEAIAGRVYVTPMVRHLGAGGDPSTATRPGLVLSERQRSILGLLRQGLPYRTIADRLGITTKTVEYHVDMLQRRVGVKGRVHLIRWAERHFGKHKEK